MRYRAVLPPGVLSWPTPEPNEDARGFVCHTEGSVPFVVTPRIEVGREPGVPRDVALVTAVARVPPAGRAARMPAQDALDLLAAAGVHGRAVARQVYSTGRLRNGWLALTAAPDPRPATPALERLVQDRPCREELARRLRAILEELPHPRVRALALMAAGEEVEDVVLEPFPLCDADQALLRRVETWIGRKD